MKTMARNVVQIHYKDQISPILDFGHNSSDYEQIIADNVDQLLNESLFHIGLTLDDNVSSYII